MGSTCSLEETAGCSWSGRCLTSSSCSPIQAAMRGSGPWPCLTTRGNAGVGATLVAVSLPRGLCGWAGLRRPPAPLKKGLCGWAGLRRPPAPLKKGLCGWAGLRRPPVRLKKPVNIGTSKRLFKKHVFL